MAALLAGSLLGGSPATGQSPDETLVAPLTGESLYDPTGPTAASPYVGDPSPIVEGAYSPSGYVAPGYGMDYDATPPVLTQQPVNWISGPYLKAGVAMGLGEDILQDQDMGWTISGGFRQGLGPAFDERLFFDLGGSYLGAYGTRTEQTPGLRTIRDLSGVVVSRDVLPNVFTTTLEEVRRGAVHMALGWYWGDVIDVRSNDPQLRVATRFGGRLGHVRGDFEDVFIPQANGPGVPPNTQTFNTAYNKTDTVGGVFLGTEVLLLNRDFSAGSLQLTVDGELANDWINFGGFASGSLSTASVMVGVMLSR